MELPKTFKTNRLSPRVGELQWMYAQLENLEIKTVLEFGCGITTWTINEATKPERYIAIEEYQPCIDQVNQHLPQIEIIDRWTKIPDIKYDLVFVDSSAGHGGRAGLYRGQATKASEDYISKGSLIMIHDSKKRSGLGPRRYLSSNENYELVANCNSKNGVQIYRRIK